EARLSLFVLAYDGARFTTTAENLAADSSAEVVSTLGSCAAATVDGAKVSYTFTRCAGVWGITGLSGTIEATYSLRDSRDPGDVIEVRLTGEDVAVNGLTISFDMTGSNAISRSLWHTGEESYEIRLDETYFPMAGDDPIDTFDDLAGSYLNNECSTRAGSA